MYTQPNEAKHKIALGDNILFDWRQKSFFFSTAHGVELSFSTNTSNTSFTNAMRCPLSGERENVENQIQSIVSMIAAQGNLKAKLISNDSLHTLYKVTK
jgi:hypothetical protein